MSCKLSLKRKEQKERIQSQLILMSCPVGGGHWDFRFLLFWLFSRSVFRFWCSLRFADFPYFGIWFSVFAKNINGFSDLEFDAVFGFPI